MCLDHWKILIFDLLLIFDLASLTEIIKKDKIFGLGLSEEKRRNKVEFHHSLLFLYLAVAMVTCNDHMFVIFSAISIPAFTCPPPKNSGTKPNFPHHIAST